MALHDDHLDPLPDLGHVRRLKAAPAAADIIEQVAFLLRRLRDEARAREASQAAESSTSEG